MTRALVIHHDANSTLGLLRASLEVHGIEIVEHTICPELDSPISGGPLPTLDGVDLVVLMGSRWSVYDHQSIGGWINDELDLIYQAHLAALPVLGLCFGAQAVAAALGGTVAPLPEPEIGWYEIESDVAGIPSGPWFEWHFDGFSLPPDASELARSAAGPQAFRIGNTMATQFHPELDAELLELWMVNDREQLRNAGVDPDALLADTRRHHVDAARRCTALVAWFLAETT